MSEAWLVLKEGERVKEGGRKGEREGGGQRHMDMALYNPRDRITQCCWAALILYLLALHTTYSVDITCGFHALILLEKHYRLRTCNRLSPKKHKLLIRHLMMLNGKDFLVCYIHVLGPESFHDYYNLTSTTM